VSRPDDTLEISDHDGVGMSAVGGAEDVMGGANVGDPVRIASLTASLRVFCRRLPAPLQPEHFHPENVQGLTCAVEFAHVNDAAQAEHGGDGGGGDAVLSGGPSRR